MGKRGDARFWAVSTLSTVLALGVLVLGRTTPAQARLAKPPYCSDRCSSWRPCTKLCRLADESVTTCGDYGLCKVPPAFAPEIEPTPVPTPTPLPACPNNAARCTTPAGDVCPAIPGLRITATSTSELTLRFDARPEGIDAATVVWDFGDGTSGTGSMTIDHTYAQAGTVKVKLTAQETTCSTSQQREVTLTMPLSLDAPPIP